MERGWTDKIFEELGVEPQSFYHFDNVPVETFKQMLAKGIIPADNYRDSQNGAPEFKSILDFNDQYQEGGVIAVGGYVVGKERSDERVTIDTVYMKPGYGIGSMLSLGTRPDEVGLEGENIRLWWD